MPDTKQAAKPAARAPKPAAANHGLIAKFKSAGTEYTIVRLSRDVGDKLPKGKTYKVSLLKDGVIQLKPEA